MEKIYKCDDCSWQGLAIEFKIIPVEMKASYDVVIHGIIKRCPKCNAFVGTENEIFLKEVEKSDWSLEDQSINYIGNIRM